MEMELFSTLPISTISTLSQFLNNIYTYMGLVSFARANYLNENFQGNYFIYDKTMLTKDEGKFQISVSYLILRFINNMKQSNQVEENQQKKFSSIVNNIIQEIFNLNFREKNDIQKIVKLKTLLKDPEIFEQLFNYATYTKIINPQEEKKRKSEKKKGGKRLKTEESDSQKAMTDLWKSPLLKIEEGSQGLEEVLSLDDKDITMEEKGKEKKKEGILTLSQNSDLLDQEQSQEY